MKVETAVKVLADLIVEIAIVNKISNAQPSFSQECVATHENVIGQWLFGMPRIP